MTSVSWLCLRVGEYLTLGKLLQCQCRDDGRAINITTLTTVLSLFDYCHYWLHCDDCLQVTLALAESFTGVSSRFSCRVEHLEVIGRSCFDEPDIVPVTN